jgi:Tfp pilus assembly protein PilX
MWHYRIKNKGFVLISILVLLSVLTMIGLFAMMQSVISQKSSRFEWQERTLFQIAQNILINIENNVLIELPDCLIEPLSQDEIVRKPLSWWETSSCAGNFHLFQYYYVVESRGMDACAKIDSLNGNDERRADYFRITLRVSSKQDSTLFLQSTLVKPTITSIACHGTDYDVSIGQQRWRVLT